MSKIRCGFDPRCSSFRVGNHTISHLALCDFFRARYGVWGIKEILRRTYAEYHEALGEDTIPHDAQLRYWEESFKERNDPPPFVLAVWCAHAHHDGDLATAVRTMSPLLVSP